MVAHEHTNWHSKYNILSWLQPWGSCPYLQVKQWFVLCGLSPILHSNLIPPSLPACFSRIQHLINILREVSYIFTWVRRDMKRDRSQSCPNMKLNDAMNFVVLRRWEGLWMLRVCHQSRGLQTYAKKEKKTNGSRPIHELEHLLV